MQQFVFATAALVGAVVTSGGPHAAPKPSLKNGQGAFIQASGATPSSAAPRPAAFAPAAAQSAAKPSRSPSGGPLFRSSNVAPSGAATGSASNRRDIALGGKWFPVPADGDRSRHLGSCPCSGSPAEVEPDCGLPADTVNGGCNSSPDVYSTIALGDSVCGTCAYDGFTRDTDWYAFTLSTTTTVTWTVNAEFPVQIAFLDSLPCPNFAFVSFVDAPACTETSLTLPDLAPGTYIAFVGPDFAGPVLSCGSDNSYHATLTASVIAGCTFDDGASEASVGLGNLGGGEELYLHKLGGVGEFTQVNSISMAWGSPAAPGEGVPDGTPATIRIFKDPDGDGIPDDLVQIQSKDFLTAGAYTDTLQQVAFDSPVQISGVYFIGVSVVSAPGQFPLAGDLSTPSGNRAWSVFETAASGGAIDYSNLPSNDVFGENASLGIDIVYLLRADCEPLDGGCGIDDGIAETEWGYGDPGEKLFLHRGGAVGEVAEIGAISMSWGSLALPGFSVPNGTPAVVRVFEDPNDDGIPDDAVEIASAGLMTEDVDTDIFHETAFSPPAVVRGVYFYAVSIVSDAGTYPLGYDTSTPSSNRAWYVGQIGGAIDYGNLPSHPRFGETSVLTPDGVFMLRADCHPTEEITAFCAPGVEGIVTCPCGNPQVPADSMKGCDNFAGGGTGGAILAGTGAATISGDSIGMSLSAGLSSNVTVLFQGTADKKSVRSGAGVACVGGTLVRLYTGNQSAGGIAFPNNGVPFHDRSADRGFPITPPVTLYYYAAYRNAAANGQPGCPGFTFGFNTTNALAVVWTP